jgi:hypothetical protein
MAQTLREEFTTLSPEEQEYVIELGMMSYKTIKSKWDVNETTKKAIKDVIVGGEMKTYLEGQGGVLIGQVKAFLEAHVSRTLTDNTRMNNQALTDNTRMNQQVLAEIQKLSQSQQEIKEKFIGTTAHQKGYEGERLVKHLLEKKFPSAEIKDISKVGDKAFDIDFLYSNISIGIEVKNVKNITTSEHIEPTLNHIKIHCKKYDGFVFASMGTKRIPKKGSFSIEEHYGAPVVFLGCDNDPNLLESLLEISVYSIKMMKVKIDKNPEQNVL